MWKLLLTAASFPHHFNFFQKIVIGGNFSQSHDHFLFTLGMLGLQICCQISDANNEIMDFVFQMCYPGYPLLAYM